MRAILREPHIRTFLATQFLLEVQFWFPVWLIFLTDQGFSITLAVAADGVFRMTVALTEIPLGLLSDRIGRKASYLALCALSALTYTWVGLVSNNVSLFGAWAVWGLTWALATGLGQAYYYELADTLLPQGDRVTAFGLLRVVISSAVLLSYLTAGLLYGVDPWLPFLTTAAMACLAFVLATRLPTTLRSSSETTVRKTYGLIRRRVRADRRLGRLVSLSVLLLIFGWSVRILFQPLLLDLDLGPGAASYLYFGFAVFSIGAGMVAGRLTARYGTPTVVRGGFALLWVAILGSGLAPTAGVFLLIPMTGLGYYLAETVLVTGVNALVEDRFRATVLSAVSFAGGLFIAFSRPGLGALADARSAATSLLAWAGVGVAVLVAVWAATRELDDPHLTPEPP